MSLDSCRPLSPLSLSLTSLLSRPVLIQGSGVGSPDPHSHLRVGRGFNGGDLSRREGSLPLIYSSGVLQHGLCCGTGRAASLWLAVSGLVRSKASRASEGPSWFCLTSAASCSYARRFSRRAATDMGICADNLVPLIPALFKKTSGALIVTVVVTIQGPASCP
jgi:hypothetical protein